MPPILALLFCIAFVIFLLKLDRRQSPNVTRTLWIPTIWLGYTSSKSLGFWFGRAGLGSELGFKIEQILIFVALVIVLRRLGRSGFPWARVFKENRTLMVLMGYMLLTVLWSDIPFSSFKRWTRDGLAMLMAFLILLEEDPRLAIQCILRRIIYVLIPFSLVLIKYFPRYGCDYHSWAGIKQWTGVCEQKNSLGQLASIAVFFLLWSLVRARRKGIRQVFRYQTPVDVLIILIALWILRGPGWYSATAIVMLAAGVMCYFGFLVTQRLRSRLVPNALTAIMLLVVIYGISAPLLGLSFSSKIASGLGRDATLTKRTDIWAGLAPVAMRKPLFGHGFRGQWTSTNLTYVKFNAHNGYLELVLGLGLTGLLLISIFILSSCRTARRELDHDYDWAAFLFCWLLMTLLNNVTEASLHTFTSLLMAVPAWLTIIFRASRLPAPDIMPEESPR